MVCIDNYNECIGIRMIVEFFKSGRENSQNARDPRGA